MDPTYAVQVALVARLKALATAAGARVYDQPPKNAPFPYITIGPAQTIPIDELCSDGSDQSVQVDVWSRAVGFPEVKQIAGTVRAGLHLQSLTIAGHVCDRVTVESTEFSRDPDGLTSRARIDLLVVTQPV